MSTFGERLKHERERRRYTQSDLARIVGVTQALLSKIEAGKTPAPGGEVVKKLAKALWVSTDYLLGMDMESEDAPPELELFADYASSVGTL